ncbi:MAG TPA: lysylphosphatidylglycerol synthase transmembrane domain-containing protein [Rubrobacteraceae bacterium]|nr:lysylphosphatidylglycerol synthase transmembrane domain-containing protein [Rubrobacteraceae bacterium]
MGLSNEMGRRFARGVLYVASIGLALHLMLPQIPGLRRSAELMMEAAPVLILLAFLAELLSELCYADLLGRSVMMSSGLGPYLRYRRHRGIGLWFTLRLAVTGYGAAHVLPGGGATAATVTYAALRSRGFERRKIALAVAAVSALVYGALGVIFAGSLLYMVLNRDLGVAQTSVAFVGFVFVLVAGAGSYEAYRNPALTRRVLVRLLLLGGRLLRRKWSRRRIESWAATAVSNVRDEIKAARRQYVSRARSTLGLAGLALGYWVFDALCLIVMFHALGVPAGAVELLVAYGVATAAGTLPFTPGGIGIFETTMITTLALLGVGSEAAIPVLGYRLFNFWLPIPLAAIFYPTLRF